MTVSPVRLNHAVLFVSDLHRSVAFYGQAFGMTVMASEPRANAAFLRLSRSGNHHDLGLFGVGPIMPWALLILTILSFVTTVQRMTHVHKNTRGAGLDT